MRFPSHEAKYSEVKQGLSVSRVLRTTVEELRPITSPSGRATWVDICKGISITLVVYWHFVGAKLALNESLIFLRMPLFFFVAGLFARHLYAPEQSRAFVNRLLGFLWLFWLWSVLTFLLTTAIQEALTEGSSPDVWFVILGMFITPPNTLWFIYALFFAFLIVFLLRKIPICIIFVVLVFAYAWSVQDGNWRGVSFPERIVRLIPFFLVGMLSFDVLNNLRIFKMASVLPLIIFLPLSYLVYFSDAASLFIITFAISLFGIFSTVVFAQFIAGSILGSIFAVIGSYTLYIYVTHRIIQFYMMGILQVAGFDWKSQTTEAITVLSCCSLLTLGLCIAVAVLSKRFSASRVLFAMPDKWKV